MTVTLPPTEALIDHAQSLDCIHCGLCLHTCPTYQLTGSEAASPRGRVHLMRAEAEGRIDVDAAFEESIDSCLLCLRCESVCPAGVQFESMVEVCRDKLNQRRPKPWLVRLARRIGFGIVLQKRWALRLAAGGLALAQALRVTRIIARFGGAQGQSLHELPPVPPRKERRLLPATLPPQGPALAEVWFMQGCVMPELFGRVNRASTRVLNAVQVTCHCNPSHTCCGALHAHNGDLEGARKLAKATIESSEQLCGSHSDSGASPLPVIVNSAGCGAHMKEYARLFEADSPWHGRAQSFSKRVLDFTEYMAEPDRLDLLRPLLSRPSLGPVAFDDPCHLCHGQGIRSAPRKLLEAVPGLHRVDLEDPESCCGSAGIHSMLRPEESAAQLTTKLKDFEQAGASALVTANPGCHLQWMVGLRQSNHPVPVLHIAEVLDDAL